MTTIRSIRQELYTLAGLDVEMRTSTELTEHYYIEKELADKLRISSREERSSLYSSLYDEHFRRVQVHLTHNQRSSSSNRPKALFPQLLFLRRFLEKNTTFLEIGAGDCSVSFALARRFVKQVYAAEVSAEAIKNVMCPPNFELILFDGFDIPLAENSIDVVYSDQVVEHLHPEDALEQLENIHKLLAQHGIYICITPHRLSGPHDISRNFDAVASGFHLKEYTYTELSDLFRHAGFSATRAYVGAMGVYIRFPLALLSLLESKLDKPMYRPLKAVANVLFGPSVRLVGLK